MGVGVVVLPRYHPRIPLLSEPMRHSHVDSSVAVAGVLKESHHVQRYHAQLEEEEEQQDELARVAWVEELGDQIGRTGGGGHTRKEQAGHGENVRVCVMKVTGP